MFEVQTGEFDLSAIMDSGQVFRIRQLSEDTFLAAAGKRAAIIRQERIRQEGAGDGAQEVRLLFSCGQEEAEGFWKDYFDLDRDYGAILRSIDPADAYLREAARRGAGGGVAGSRAAAFVWRRAFGQEAASAGVGELAIWCPCADSRRVGAERAARRRAEAVRSGHCGRGLRGAGRGGRGVRALPSRWGTAAFAIQAKGRPRRRKDRSVFKVRVWGEKIPFTQPAESGGLLQKNATLPGISQKEYRKFTIYS